MMSKRKQLARERLELVLVQLLLAYRYLIFICGLILMMFAIAVLLMAPQAGLALLLPAVLMLLVSNSYQVTVYLSRFGAWIGTLGQRDD